MPATQRGSVRKLASGRYQLRYYDREGERQHRRIVPDPLRRLRTTTTT